MGCNVHTMYNAFFDAKSVIYCTEKYALLFKHALEKRSAELTIAECLFNSKDLYYIHKNLRTAEFLHPFPVRRVE